MTVEYYILRNFIIFTPSNIVGLIKSRRMGLAGHVAYIRTMGNVFQIYKRKLPGNDHLVDLYADFRTILK